MKECKCDLRTKLVGDGCSICNPELAKEYGCFEDPICICTHKLSEHNKKYKCKVCKCEEFNRADWIECIEEE